MSLSALHDVRYTAERATQDELAAEPTLAELFRDHRPSPALGSVRKTFLADAVRIDRCVLPELDEAIDATSERLGLGGRLECYVHSGAEIQAGVARSGENFLIVLASAAIERLTPKELEFVIGHEIGHVVYGHLDTPAPSSLADDRRLTAKLTIRLLAWSRMKEISADRAGLIACGSLDAAASALFKVASGLSIPGLKVHPLEFGAQFDALRQEIFRQGAEELGMWTLSHPLVPLRMKALGLFWATQPAAAAIREAPGGGAIAVCDREVAAMLACMNPLAQRGEDSADPSLRELVTWAGLYVAGCNGRLERNELASLAALVGQSHLREAIGAGPPQLDRFRRELLRALAERQTPVSALDINRLFVCLIAIARADGGLEASELAALHELAGHLHVASGYIDALVRDPQ